MARKRVEIEFSDGKPSAIVWSDGRKFGINKVLYICETRPRNFRYTVLVGKNEERYLYVTPKGKFVDTV